MRPWSPGGPAERGSGDIGDWPSGQIRAHIFSRDGPLATHNAQPPHQSPLFLLSPDISMLSEKSLMAFQARVKSSDYNGGKWISMLDMCVWSRAQPKTARQDSSLLLPTCGRFSKVKRQRQLNWRSTVKSALGYSFTTPLEKMAGRHS